MSQELPNTRRALTRVSSDLKQKQMISAVTATMEGARIFGRIPMMKSEQDELMALLQTAADHLRHNKEIATVFPLAIKYVPGQEADFADLMLQLLEALQQSSTEEAVEKHKAIQQEQLAKAREELENQKFDEARKTLESLVNMYSEDGALALEVGDSFMNAGLFEDAVRYLLAAIKLVPNSAHTLNRLGIAMRKLKRGTEAEMYFIRALGLDPDDPYLHFNLGRLYLDSSRWQDAVNSATNALRLNPAFTEAGKMISYARRKLGQE